VRLARALRAAGRLLASLRRLLAREWRVECAFCDAVAPVAGSEYASWVAARHQGFSRYALDTWACEGCRPCLAQPGDGGEPC
jgi:hypothetical protein